MEYTISYKSFVAKLSFQKDVTQHLVAADNDQRKTVHEVRHFVCRDRALSRSVEWVQSNIVPARRWRSDDRSELNRRTHLSAILPTRFRVFPLTCTRTTCSRDCSA